MASSSQPLEPPSIEEDGAVASHQAAGRGRSGRASGRGRGRGSGRASKAPPSDDADATSPSSLSRVAPADAACASPEVEPRVPSPEVAQVSLPPLEAIAAAAGGWQAVFPDLQLQHEHAELVGTGEGKGGKGGPNEEAAKEEADEATEASPGSPTPRVAPSVSVTSATPPSAHDEETADEDGEMVLVMRADMEMCRAEGIALHAWYLNLPKASQLTLIKHLSEEERAEIEGEVDGFLKTKTTNSRPRQDGAAQRAAAAVHGGPSGGYGGQQSGQHNAYGGHGQYNAYGGYGGAPRSLFAGLEEVQLDRTTSLLNMSKGQRKALARRREQEAEELSRDMGGLVLEQNREPAELEQELARSHSTATEGRKEKKGSSREHKKLSREAIDNMTVRQVRRALEERGEKPVGMGQPDELKRLRDHAKSLRSVCLHPVDHKSSRLFAQAAGKDAEEDDDEAPAPPPAPAPVMDALNRMVGTAQQWLSLGKDALGESDAERQQREAERAKDEEAKEKRRALEAKLKEARSRRVGSSFGRDLVLPGER